MKTAYAMIEIVSATSQNGIAFVNNFIAIISKNNVRSRDRQSSYY